ncbi:hypothetical protein ACGFIP_29665 [Micromonospora zamorensis]|uniref:hypothetical protein n=1 Tax=Micromonospora zamorensis TaxID=709883 RepID=UPI00371BC173
MTSADVHALNQVAAAPLEEHPSTLPFHSPSGGRNWPLIQTADDAPPPDFAVDGPDWVARMLIYPALRHHLIHGDTVTETAARFADEVLGVAADAALRYRSQSPLANVVTADGGPLTVGTVTVRMLDGVEQHQWYPNNPDYRMWRTGSATTEPPTALLEITSIGPRNDWFFPPRESVERLGTVERPDPGPGRIASPGDFDGRVTHRRRRRHHGPSPRRSLPREQA